MVVNKFISIFDLVHTELEDVTLHQVLAWNKCLTRRLRLAQ